MLRIKTKRFCRLSFNGLGSSTLYFFVCVDNDLPNVDVPRDINLNFTDPMDPEVCCEEPKECMCQFGCVGMVTTTTSLIE